MEDITFPIRLWKVEGATHFAATSIIKIMFIYIKYNIIVYSIIHDKSVVESCHEAILYCGGILYCEHWILG